MKKKHIDTLHTSFLVLLAFATAFLFMITYIEIGLENEITGHETAYTKTFIYIVIILATAKLSNFIEKWKQPRVLGELLVGVILGNLTIIGITFLEPMAHNDILHFLAELGVVILLFQIGLESKIQELFRFGKQSVAVALSGIIFPIVLVGFIFAPLFSSDLSFVSYLFLGATLAPTSVGISARVFKDLKKLKTAEAQVVLGAAVIDDILALIILAVISTLITTGQLSTLTILYLIFKSILFFIAAIVLGQFFEATISEYYSKINTGMGTKFTLALCFGLLFAYIASLIGIAPILGAFAAGLILDPVQFRHYKNPEFVEDLKETIHGVPKKIAYPIKQVMKKHSLKHIEHIIEPISLFLVPIFFVMAGFNVKLSHLFDFSILGAALVLTFLAILSKVLSGLFIDHANPWIVGWGMVPRGEVVLIFATIGKSLGIITEALFSMLVIVVLLTSLLTPFILNYTIRVCKCKEM